MNRRMSLLEELQRQKPKFKDCFTCIHMEDFDAQLCQLCAATDNKDYYEPMEVGKEDDKIL